MKIFCGFMGLLAGVLLGASFLFAQGRPYLRSFKCHDGFEPGRWYEFTLEIYDGSELPKVSRLRSFVESPFGDRFNEVDYASSVAATYDRIVGHTEEASLELVWGASLSPIWDIKMVTVNEKFKADGNSSSAQAKCVFIGARP